MLFTRSPKGCTSLPSLGYAEPYARNVTFHLIITIVSAIVTTLCVWCSFGLAFNHLANYTHPSIQRLVIRIVLTTAIFAVFNLFAVAFYAAAPYLVPIPELYECFALITLFLLLVQLAAPERELHETVSAEHAYDYSAAGQTAKVSRRWFVIIWIMVYQILPGRILTTIAAEIVEARRCHSSEAYRIAHIVIAVIQSVQTVICLTGILAFHHRFMSKLRRHDGGTKLVIFKLLVLIQLVQRIVFFALELYHEFRPTKHISYLDLTLGIPSALTCFEAFVFSVVFLWPFSTKPLQANTIAPQTTTMPFRAAFVDIFKLSYILAKTWRLRPESSFLGQSGHAAAVEYDAPLHGDEIQEGVQHVQQVFIVPNGSAKFQSL